MVELRKISGSFFFSAFYLVSGIALFIPVVLSGSPAVHAVALGALSLIASYGLSKKKRWSMYLTILIALPGIAFGCVTIYALCQTASLGLTEAVLIPATVLYVALLAVSLFYALYKRDRID